MIYFQKRTTYVLEMWTNIYTLLFYIELQIGIVTNFSEKHMTLKTYLQHILFRYQGYHEDGPGDICLPLQL